MSRWWWEAIPTRLNEPDRGIKMIIQQRVHRADLAGQALERGYYPVVIPMEFDPKHPNIHPRDPRKVEGELMHPARIDRKALQTLKNALGSYGAAGQLQQLPVPREGGMFKRHWFGVVDAVPAEVLTKTVRRWDLAATVAVPGKDPDWTVGVKVGMDEIGRVYVLDVVRFRDSPANVDKAIKVTVQRDGHQVSTVLPQDPGQAGVAQVQALARFLAPFPVSFVREQGTKETRARGFAVQAEVGNVHLLRGSWNEDLLSELGDFPNGAHDDQVDALVGAFTALFEGKTGFLDWARANAQQAAAAAEPPDTKDSKSTFVWG